MFIDGMRFRGYIFYIHNVVGGVVNYNYVIYGVTLPVLKNEIEDFFFARLGTGRTYRYSFRRNVCRHATTRLQTYIIVEFIGVGKICTWHVWRDIILTQRCLWGCIFYVQHIWRRDITRRYVLGDTQSEYMFINWKGFMASILNGFTVVGNNTYSKNTIMGGAM